MADIFQIVENNGTPKDIGDSKARANIAPTFDVSKANAIGDLVLSDTGILYRFNAAYTAGTSWNSRTSKEQVNIANELNNAVKKSGDDMTGPLQFYPGNGSNINFFDSRMGGHSDADVSSDKWLSQIKFYDKNSVERSYIQQADLTSGQGIQLETIRQLSNGAYSYNGITFLIKNDGTHVTRISSPSSFRNGLSAAQRSDLGIVENTNNATRVIYAGQYVIWKGNLYIANTTIANGAALSTSNLSQVTIGGLNRLDDNFNVKEVTVTLNSNAVKSGSIKCYKVSRLCYVHVDNLVFKNAGTGMQIATGLPTAFEQVEVIPCGAGGENKSVYLDTFYIPKDATVLNCHTYTSTKDLAHWATLVYICKDR